MLLAHDLLEKIIPRPVVPVQVRHEHGQHEEQQQQRLVARSKLPIPERLDLLVDGELSTEEAGGLGSAALVVLPSSALTQPRGDQVIRSTIDRGLFRETIVGPAQVAGREYLLLQRLKRVSFVPFIRAK